MANSAQKICDKIDAALKASDEIKAGNYVTVKVEKAGLFGKPHIVLTGRTTSEAMKTKINAIAAPLAEGLEIKDEMRISSTA